MKQKQRQSQKRKYDELVAKFRQAYPPSSSMLGNFVSYIKILGDKLIDNLGAFYQNFKNGLDKSSKPSKVQETTTQDGKQSQIKRKRMVLNFNEFEYNENIDIEVQSQQPKKETLQKPVRSYRFKMEQIKECNEEQDKDKDQDIDLFLRRIGKKKVKVNPKYENDSHMIQTLVNEPPQVTKHFNEIYNQVMLDHVEILSEERQIKEKEKKKKPMNESIQQVHQNYLKKIGIDNEKDGTKGSHKRLYEMVKKRRELVEKRPPRKKVHLQADLPPIYSVEKVLKVLEMQKQQFFKEKRMKLQEQQRQKRQKELQEEVQKQNERKARQERIPQQAQQRARKEIQEKQNEQMVFLIPEDEEKDKFNTLENNPQKDKLQLQCIPLQNESQHQQNPAKYESPIQKEKQQIKDIFQTPKKEIKPINQNLLNASNNRSNKSSSIKQNPFINRNASPAKAPTLTLQDLMKKEPASMFNHFPSVTQNQFNFGSAFFSQNLQQTNLFNSMPNQNQIFPKTNFNETSPLKFNSPNTFLHNPIQKTIPQFPLYNPPQNTQFNNVNQSNKNQGDVVSPFGQQKSLQSGQAPNSPFSFGSFFNNNQTVARMFDRNLFAPQNQPPTSLFGAAPQQNLKQISSRGGRRTKNQIRIN